MKKLNIFTDFDGTITLNDVGDTLFETFGDERWEKVLRDWQEGVISSRECLTLGCAITKISHEQLIDFIDQQMIDPHFHEFVRFCDQHQIPLTILSDGFDFYIKRILAHHGLTSLPVLANTIFFEDSYRIRPEFPYYGKGCSSCANCKGYHIANLRPADNVVVFIGDGLSDRCAVQQADIIFAKNSLELYCLQKKINYYKFQNFSDVIRRIKELN